MFERRNYRKHFFFLMHGFLWWPNNDLAKEPVDYQILVHSFGATSSPSCASFCLKKTDLDNLDKFDEEPLTLSTGTFTKTIALSQSLRLTKWHACLASFENCCPEEGFDLPNGSVTTGT